ncbi:ThuA domain-containing protein [Aquimarina algiphila]|uniref:ThuA domain-containing protein n=1 Tax=Aquimarina algiphila TaxID=2047982 RepID=UPI00249004EE|nr:ThuA domain-containing protein [Aquimarina algiphila]
MKEILSIILFSVTILSFSNTNKTFQKSGLNILVFTRTETYRHHSISDGLKSIREISDEQLWEMTATEDPSFFNTTYLEKVDVIVFLNTSGNILNKEEKKDFENFIRNGGGFVGIHAASDTEYNWPFYQDLIGAQFKNHPEVQKARLIVHKNTRHPATNFLENEWITTDEWYYFKEPLKEHCNVLLELDESTIKRKITTGKPHPISWFHEKFVGRTFYTGLGHTKVQYANPFFKEHLKNAILWAGKQYDIQISNTWNNLLDKDLTKWNSFIGVPHTSVTLPFEFPKKDDVKKGKPLGLNNDPLQVFSVIEDKKGVFVLKISGEIYGGLTTKNMYQNYHFKCEFKWGDKKWEPRLDAKRDTGILFHATGKHGAFWNVWMRSLECQVQEKDFGDFFPLSGTIADIPVKDSTHKEGHIYDANGKEITSAYIEKYRGGRIRRSKNMENAHGEWNTLEIYTVDDKAVFIVNDELVSALKNTRYQESNNLEIPLHGGRIQIQSEGAEGYYRAIQIRGIDVFPKEILKITGW